MMPITISSSSSVNAVSGDDRFTISVQSFYRRRRKNCVARGWWPRRPDMKETVPQWGVCFFRELNDFFYGNTGVKFRETCAISDKIGHELMPSRQSACVWKENPPYRLPDGSQAGAVVIRGYFSGGSRATEAGPRLAAPL
jgi:hypothetical protein